MRPSLRHCVPVGCACIVLLALGACSQAAGPDAAGASRASRASVAAAEPSPPAAAPGPQPAQQDAWEALLRRLDRDGDGVIARSEHAIAAAVMFARMDRDGDERVTVEEMDSEREALLDSAPTDTARRLAQVDADQDGGLDTREHDAATRVVFDQYDRDGDARLVREEFVAVLARLEAAR